MDLSFSPHACTGERPREATGDGICLQAEKRALSRNCISQCLNLGLPFSETEKQTSAV